MEQIDYACGIDCPDGADDEQIVSERQRIRAELDREMPGVSIAGHS